MVTCQVCPGHISSFNIIKHTSKFIIITSKVWSHLKHQFYKDLAHCRAAFRIDWSREALLSSRFVRSFFTINVTDLVRQTMEEEIENYFNDRNFFQPYLDVDSKSVDPTGWKWFVLKQVSQSRQLFWTFVKRTTFQCSRCSANDYWARNRLRWNKKSQHYCILFWVDPSLSFVSLTLINKHKTYCERAFTILKITLTNLSCGPSSICSILWQKSPNDSIQHYQLSIHLSYFVTNNKYLRSPALYCLGRWGPWCRKDSGDYRLARPHHLGQTIMVLVTTTTMLMMMLIHPKKDHSTILVLLLEEKHCLFVSAYVSFKNLSSAHY